MSRNLYFLLFLAAGLLLGCSKDSNGDNNDVFTDEFSFNLGGTNFSYDEFEIKTDWLESQNRIFIKKEEGDNIFTMNFPLDLNTGNNGMNWNNGGVWFFMETSNGAFYTLDETTSFMNVIEIDTVARTINATFQGIGSQAVSTDTSPFTNGVIKASY